MILKQIIKRVSLKYLRESSKNNLEYYYCIPLAHRASQKPGNKREVLNQSPQAQIAVRKL